MDIKNKFPPSPPKGAGADAKKNQDVVNTKVYPQRRRRREVTGAGNFSKNEQPRKWNVQKAKDTVKRPRAKGQYHGGTEENTKVVAAKWAEPGSVLVHGCKKENYLLNGNHLLNFHYEPRNAQNRNVGKSTGNNRNSNRWLPPIQRHKYNKEQFLQASCQFVVIAGGDYSLYWTNPDVLVDWKLVEQIKVHSSENLSCPICLCPPVAGKMTRCGHVYCWPCILHYIDVSDKKDASCKCPICYATVHKDDLKSMVEITQTTFNLGDTLNLRLMRRERGSVLATPVESAAHPTPPAATFLPVSANSDNQIYSKLLIASVQDIVNIIELERVQLELEYEDYPDCYIERALNELSRRENQLLSKASGDALSTEDITEKTIAEQTSRENEVNTDACCKNDTKFLETVQAEQSSKIVDSASNDGQCASGPSRFVYFYQADDGQHLYLHAMNVKMLEMQYGGLEHCPPVITGKLLEKEAGSYTEDLKRRLRYLCHLPLTCQFELAEIELRPPLVSDQVLRAFRDQLNLRKERRQRREREEKKRDKKITEEQNKRMGKYPTPDINIESNRHFPQWNPELLFSEQRALSSPEPTTMSSIASSPSSSTFDEVATGQGNAFLEHEQQQAPSFAEMLRNTKTPVRSSNVWPSVASSGQSTTTRSGTAGALSKEDEDAEEAYYASPPSNNQCLGDALARALEQTRLEDSGEGSNAAGKKNKKQKKKKTKGTVLFATGMTCAS
ncbi:PREDICTED: RING finger protein 10 [Dinoponera quadriceps]|uniref:E3 ubiquitin-protein ligase RNF10 n=1 Tax=Dinoponera quadriceps TaxID=609295 RepID=A0A6P3XQN4_DINQU|nr:PREDICTED: RING finger protein 10 [Dinoponera quadriceps]